MRIPVRSTCVRLLAIPASNRATSAPSTETHPGLLRRRVSLVVAALVIASTIIGLDVQGSARSAEASASSSPRPSSVAIPAPRPNVVLIVTDDQRYDTLQVMPNLRRLIGSRGVRFTNALVSNPFCCPSRASILTGRFSHGTGVYGNTGESGGWPAFARSGAERSTIAHALDAAGYRTALFGKYLNGYSRAPRGYVPPGWDRWFTFAGANGAYYDYTTFDDRRGFETHGHAPRDYSTDVFRRRAVRFIRNTPDRTPFFVMLTPFGPHDPWRPAPRHEGAFSGATVDLGPAFNEDVADKPPYIRLRPPSDTASMQARTRHEWETLLSIDDLVSRVFGVLRETRRVRDTLFIFMSDHGLSNGQHRWEHKLTPYEESIRIPLLVRYPAGGIRGGRVSNALAANVDIAPTIADFAGVPLPGSEGASLRSVLTGRKQEIRRGLLLEHAGDGGGPTVPPYCGIRTHGFMYARYADGFEELYDLIADPNELENVVSAPALQTTRADLEGRVKVLCMPRPPGFAFPA